MNQIKEFVEDQKNFLFAIFISVLFNFTVTIEHENSIVALLFRLIFIIFVALLVNSFIRLIKNL